MRSLLLSTLYFLCTLSTPMAYLSNPMSDGTTSTYLTTLAKRPYIEEGMRLPSISFKVRVRSETNPSEFEWATKTTQDLFLGKRCVLFAIPGAFTPTCSNQHLPEYQKAYSHFKRLGIDAIYCLSVNDAFVLQKWGELQGLTADKTPHSLGFEEVNFIPDGCAKFTRRVGMNCYWDHERGFGERSWRYSALVQNGIVQKLFVERPIVPDSAWDPYSVSDAKTMLQYLDPLIELDPNEFNGLHDDDSGCDLY